MASVAETAPISDEELVPKQELRLYTGVEYFEALAQDIAETSAGDRVAIMTMSFEPSEPLVDEVLLELCAAADRKANVTFGVDAFTLMVDDSSKNFGPLWLPIPIGQQNYQRRLEALQKLAEKPTASCSIINKPARYLSNPYSHRSHLKVSVVNDRVYLGGPNLHKTERSDMVVVLKDPKTADWLYDLSIKIAESGSTKNALGDEDQNHQIDNSTRILIDAGKPNQSIIMDEALRLVAEAKERVFASFQYFPTGDMASELVEAYGRGAEVRPFHNHPGKYNALLGAHQRIMMLIQSRKMPSNFFANVVPLSVPFLHSKVITTENAAMVGSHNYVDKGVKYGTPEIALLREDPDFARRVGNLLLKQTCVVDGPVLERIRSVPLQPVESLGQTNT